MKKIFLGIGIFVLLIVLGLGIGIFLNDSAQKQEENITIGAILPLSNSILSSRGVDTKKSIEIAVAQINVEGGVNGKKIELVLEDNEGKNEKSVSAVNKLLLYEDINVIFTLFTGPTSAIAPIIKENNKLLLYQSTVFSMARDKDAFICNDYWSFETLGTKYAEVAYQEKVQKVGLLRSQTEQGETFEKFFIKKADELGVNYIIETFKLDDTDVSTQLTKFKFGNVDTVISDGFANNYFNLFKGINDLNYKGLTIMGTSTLYDISKLNEPEPIALQVMNSSKIMSSYHRINDSDDFNIFLDKWYQQSSNYPQTEAIYAYDDMKILATALEYCDANSSVGDTACLYNQIKSKEVNVLEGSISIDDDCIFGRQFDVLMYNNGDWIKYDEKNN